MRNATCVSGSTVRHRGSRHTIARTPLVRARSAARPPVGRLRWWPYCSQLAPHCQRPLTKRWLGSGPKSQRLSWKHRVRLSSVQAALTRWRWLPSAPCPMRIDPGRERSPRHRRGGSVDLNSLLPAARASRASGATATPARWTHPSRLRPGCEPRRCWIPPAPPVVRPLPRAMHPAKVHRPGPARWPSTQAMRKGPSPR